MFCYERRFWISIPKDAKDKLEFFINNELSMITWKNYFIRICDIKNEFQKRRPKSNIWLFADRDIEADDNAEHLYRYVMNNHPEQEIVFALRKDSKDWDRLEKEGFNLVECYSYNFLKLCKDIKYFITSHTPQSFKIHLGKNQKFLFLGHGVDAVNISNWFNNLNITLRFSTCYKEYNSIAGDYNNYKLTKKEVVLTGLPRHDNLLKNNKTNTKQILIMPTWRYYLVDVIDLPFNKKVNDDFINSEYFIKWNSFLNNKILKNICDKYGYKVIFVPHFNMKSMISKMSIPSYINLSYRKEGCSFQLNFQDSDLMITDYTSAAFEMGYLRKPVIYYQFDKNYFFNNHSYRQGWFDYERDGFGPVVYDEDELLYELNLLLKNNCIPNKKYIKNMEDLFFDRSGNICKNVYSSIIELDKFYTND